MWARVAVARVRLHGSTPACSARRGGMGSSPAPPGTGCVRWSKIALAGATPGGARAACDQVLLGDAWIVLDPCPRPCGVADWPDCHAWVKDAHHPWPHVPAAPPWAADPARVAPQRTQANPTHSDAPPPVCTRGWLNGSRVRTRERSKKAVRDRVGDRARLGSDQEQPIELPQFRHL